MVTLYPQLHEQERRKLGPDFVGKFSLFEWFVIIGAWAGMILAVGFIMFAFESMAQSLFERLASS